MYVVQSTFQAKPGKAQALIDRFTAAAGELSGVAVKDHRVLVDHIADFWTVIFETTVEDLDAYFTAVANPKARETMAGYMDLVQSGHRRVYRVAHSG
jgi:hypothetical protein